MNINKVYQNVDPDLIHSELEAALKRHSASIDDKRSYKRTLTAGAFQGEIHALFPVEVQRTVKSGMFSTKRITEQQLVEAFTSRVVGQSDKCKLMIEAKEDIIGMGTLTRIEEDLKFVVGAWEVVES